MHVQVCEAAENLQPHAGCFHMSYETSSHWEMSRATQPEGCQKQDAENNTPNSTTENPNAQMKHSGACAGEKEQVCRHTVAIESCTRPQLLQQNSGHLPKGRELSTGVHA
jgi:hypothetical protein